MRLIMLTAMFLAGCSPAESVEDIARKQAEATWPGSTKGPDGKPMVPVIEDKGDTWLVSYRLPNGWTGGTPEITIRKSDKKVVSYTHTQ
jgi:hypothetical protein